MLDTNTQHIFYPVYYGLDNRLMAEHRPLAYGGQLCDRKVGLLAHAAPDTFFPMVTPHSGTPLAKLEASLSVMTSRKHALVPVLHLGDERTWDNITLTKDSYPYSLLDLLVTEQMYRDWYPVRVYRSPLVLPARFGGAHAAIQVAFLDAVARADYCARLRTSHRGHPV